MALDTRVTAQTAGANSIKGIRIRQVVGSADLYASLGEMNPLVRGILFLYQSYVYMYIEVFSTLNLSPYQAQGVDIVKPRSESDDFPNLPLGSFDSV